MEPFSHFFESGYVMNPCVQEWSFKRLMREAYDIRLAITLFHYFDKGHLMNPCMQEKTIDKASRLV